MTLRNGRINHFRKQQGVVLFISLIVLVAMTLAGIALVRSVDTTNLIAGNLAFKQGATLTAEAATEKARNWLTAQPNPNVTLQTDNAANGYYSAPALTGQGTERFWDQPTAAGGYDWTNNSQPAYTDPLGNPSNDAAGNQVSYVIQRLCSLAGQPVGAPNSCISTTSAPPNCNQLGNPCAQGQTVYYYRITAKITGPRNTVSYVQTVIQI